MNLCSNQSTPELSLTIYRAVHKEGIKCLELLLKTDHTYFKDHKGRTILHHAAEVGSMVACELVLSKRADAVHDLDRMVSRSHGSVPTSCWEIRFLEM